MCVHSQANASMGHKENSRMLEPSPPRLTRVLLNFGNGLMYSNMEWVGPAEKG